MNDWMNERPLLSWGRAPLFDSAGEKDYNPITQQRSPLRTSPIRLKEATTLKRETTRNM